jgi:hypothetical protein
MDRSAAPAETQLGQTRRGFLGRLLAAGAVAVAAPALHALKVVDDVHEAGGLLKYMHANVPELTRAQALAFFNSEALWLKMRRDGMSTIVRAGGSTSVRIPVRS